MICCLNAVVTIGFERRVYSVEESSMIVEIGVIVLEGTLSREVKVTIRSMDGTARSTGMHLPLSLSLSLSHMIIRPTPISAGTVDFTPIDQTLTFSREVTEVNVTVMIVDDAVNEMREQFAANLQLITSDANVIVNPNVTTIFIEDDDRKLKRGSILGHTISS